MAAVDLIPSVFRLTGVAIDTGDSYRSPSFNVGAGKNVIGITVKASQSLSVELAYGRLGTDTAAAAGQASSASLPYKTAATTFASEATAAEGGTYHEITVPPMATIAQLVVSNASGSNVTGASIDAALRAQRMQATSGGGGGGGATTDAGDLTSGTLAAARLPGVLANVDTAAELRTAAQLSSADSPQFTAINLGHASDTTITRTGAGVVAIEGVEITTNSGTQTLTNKSIAASQLTGTVATARLGSGTADNTTFLRGDQTWATPSGGGSSAYAGLSTYKSTDQSVAASTNTDVTWTNLKTSSAFSHSDGSASITVNGARTVTVRATIYYEPGGGSYGEQHVAIFNGATELARFPVFSYGSTSSRIYGVALLDYEGDFADTDVIKIQIRPDANGGTVKGRTGSIDRSVLILGTVGV